MTAKHKLTNKTNGDTVPQLSKACYVCSSFDPSSLWDPGEPWTFLNSFPVTLPCEELAAMQAVQKKQELITTDQGNVIKVKQLLSYAEKMNRLILVSFGSVSFNDLVIYIYVHLTNLQYYSKRILYK